jgi:hypothetical protein
LRIPAILTPIPAMLTPPFPKGIPQVNPILIYQNRQAQN